MKANVYSRQMFIISLTSILGFGIFRTAHIAASYMSTGAWLAILITALVFIIPALVFSVLARRYEGDTFFSYSKKIMGKTLGKAVSFVFALFYLLFAAYSVSYFSHIASMWILPNTSFRFISAFIVLVCAYALSHGFTSMIRLVSFVGTITVIAVIVVRLIMVFSSDTSNLLPVFEVDVIKKGLLNAIVSSSVFFYGIGVVAIVPNNTSSKGSILASVGGVAAAALVLILVCASCFCVLGPLRTGMYSDAVALSMKAFDISRITFIQRADIIFIVTWTLLILSAVCSTCYIPYEYIKSTLPKSKMFLGSSIVCILIFVFANTAPESQTALLYINRLCIILGTVSLFLIPIIILIMSGVRHEKKK